MANTFKRKIVATAGAGTPVNLYTVPAATTTVVIGFMISNLTGSQVKVTIEAASVNIGTDLPIPAGSVLSALDGKMVLETTDVVSVEADVANAVECILSIMEIT